jgi:UrcA family protein
MRLSATAVIASIAALAGAVPALAQTVDELTVTGRALRDSPESLSERVSYADLNLTLASDRRILAHRVSAAAGRVCDRLNEPRPSAGNLGHSCQDIAVRGAMGQVRLAFADARAAPAYAGANAAQASAIVPMRVASSGPIPDTPQNRARYGGPASRAGKRTAARGN